jgi:hypothetical protein
VLPYQLVPSLKNENTSCLLAVLVIVGAVPAGHFTVDQVTVKLPAPVLSMMMNDLPDTAVGMVIVGLPVRVSICTVPLVKASVIAVLVLAVNGVSV